MQEHGRLIWVLGVALAIAPACDDGDDGDDGGDDAAGSTGHSHDTEGQGDTAHDDGEDTSVGADGGTADGSGSGDGGGDDAATTYCTCLLVNCHDPFHERYGDGDDVALPACMEAAASFPSVGMDAMSGDSLECRQHFCNEAAMDETACAAALGDETCVAR